MLSWGIAILAMAKLVAVWNDISLTRVLTLLKPRYRAIYPFHIRCIIVKRGCYTHFRDNENDPQEYLPSQRSPVYTKCIKGCSSRHEKSFWVIPTTEGSDPGARLRGGHATMRHCYLCLCKRCSSVSHHLGVWRTGVVYFTCYRYRS